MAEQVTRRVFENEEEVSVVLAKYISGLSAKLIREKGSFSVVLSGGSMIDTMRKLIEPPYLKSVEWSKWMIFFLDERVVPLTDPDSNYKLVYDGLLSKVPIPKENIYPIKEYIYPINDKLSVPEAAADDYEERLKHLVETKKLPLSSKTGFPKFDLMLVGMGPEGHVASMFCWHFQRYEKQRWVTFIKDSPKPPAERITFTFPLINSSSEIALVITGEEASYAIKVALGKNSADHSPLPIEMVAPEGKLSWFLDRDATSRLNH